MESIPATGYTLPLWNLRGQYRATAIAYMQRENVDSVENSNGKFYTLNMLINATIH